jgi:hypothetical protein
MKLHTRFVIFFQYFSQVINFIQSQANYRLTLFFIGTKFFTKLCIYFYPTI